eukprot:15460772-Alexandrium_andersonii.AAC.1
MAHCSGNLSVCPHRPRSALPDQLRTRPRNPAQSCGNRPLRHTAQPHVTLYSACWLVTCIQPRTGSAPPSPSLKDHMAPKGCD